MEFFIKRSNAVYVAVQTSFSYKTNYVHRKIIARELSSQLANHYPELIISLKEGFEQEANQQMQWIETKF